MKKIITFILLSSFVVGTFGYTANDVAQANYLASKKIIKDWSSAPKNYRFDDYIARSEIMGMVLAMMNITRNAHCRGDFADVPKSDTDWVCRTIETAADRGFINAKPAGMKTRPYGNITRAEALGILKNALPKEGGASEIGYYQEFEDSNYRHKFYFGADWQAWLFFRYTKVILQNDAALKINPRPDDNATRREVFDFAYQISRKQNTTVSCGEWNNSDFRYLNTPAGLDLLALAGTNDKFCSSGTMSHLYENNTGIAWSCDGTTNRICKTDAFSYGTSRLKVDNVSGEGKKGALVTLNVSNFPFNSIMQIQAGNYSRHAMIQLVEGFGVSADGKKVTFTLPANLNGAMGEIPGESHLPDEPYAIYLTNTSNGEYVKLYNPFGTGATQ